MGSTQRAAELQQLAAGSGSLLESSQLATAAQRCSQQAQTASQMAELARAEAERLSGNSTALGLSADGPESGVSANGPGLAASEVVSTSAAVEGQVQSTESGSSPFSASAVADVSSVLTAEADSAAEAQTAVSTVGSQPRPVAELAPGSTGTSGMTHDSIELIHSLSAEMQATMQRLVASAQAQSSSSSYMHGQGMTTAVQHGAVGVSTPWQTSHVTGAQSQGSDHVSVSRLGMHSSALVTPAQLQTPSLPHQAAWQLPGDPNSSFQGPAHPQMDATPGLPTQATNRSPKADEIPSGMQLHLMHQLEGLERSVRRVEQQVSATKQTRRRLKTASLPAQVQPCSCSLHLAGCCLPMQWSPIMQYE